MHPFDRNEHVYRSYAFDEIIKDTIRFFNGTPVLQFPMSERFEGSGVYALYYTGTHEIYQEISAENRMEYRQPIYVGKAVPPGWRQGRSNALLKSSFVLHRRLAEHYKSLEQANNINVLDFTCRLAIFEENSSDIISAVEAALIRHYLPIWNTKIDGFGNHDPGSGRYNQSKSDWDMLHPGRPWAEKCTGTKVKARLSKDFDLSTNKTNRHD